VQDATIWQATPTWSDGVSTTLYTGTGTGGFRAALLRFDLSLLPSEASVISATLTLSQGYKTALSIVRVHEVLSSWSEGTVTWGSLNGSYSSAVVASFLSGNGTAGSRTTGSSSRRIRSCAPRSRAASRRRRTAGPSWRSATCREPKALAGDQQRAPRSPS
jgi:hypothetical protein